MRIGDADADPLELLATSRPVSPQSLQLDLTAGERRCRFQVATDGSMQVVEGSSALIDRVTGEVTELGDFLELNPPTVIFGDGSVVTGPQVYRQPSDMARCHPKRAS